MSDLIQIVYISRSTFPPLPAENGIEPSVARILVQSRMNNAKRGLVGALYFGDGCFFQCLQGTTEAVDRLYAALLEDPRHTDLKLLSRRPIAETTFATWSMKYVPLDDAMKGLLAERGLSTFDPYRFDVGTVQQVMQLLQDGADVAPTPSPMLGRSVDAPFVTRTAVGTGRSQSTSKIALVVAAVALGIAIAAMWFRAA